jgi:Fe-S cluster assembly protein SufD
MAQAVTAKENYFSAFKLFANARAENDPAWLANLRDKAGERFEALDFPTTRDEEWKYTNIAPLLKVPFRQVFRAGFTRPYCGEHRAVHLR